MSHYGIRAVYPEDDLFESKWYELPCFSKSRCFENKKRLDRSDDVGKSSESGGSKYCFYRDSYYVFVLALELWDLCRVWVSMAHRPSSSSSSPTDPEVPNMVRVKDSFVEAMQQQNTSLVQQNNVISQQLEAARIIWWLLLHHFNPRFDSPNPKPLSRSWPEGTNLAVEAGGKLGRAEAIDGDDATLFDKELLVITLNVVAEHGAKTLDAAVAETMDASVAKTKKTCLAVATLLLVALLGARSGSKGEAWRVSEFRACMMAENDG
ncbi:hypothetical protein V8G54_008838 [Vigna mungo]|uniref:Uncharacterized protein n=1 Tax=Vigna mungo TaxID=3915 RepID=A0AAQ3P5W4_VIGMU